MKALLKQWAYENPVSLFLYKKMNDYRQSGIKTLVKSGKSLPIVVVVPSYNNARWCEKNLFSLFHQEYDNFRVIYIDDSSQDGTYDKVEALVDKYDKQNRFTLIRNTANQGAMKNLFDAIHSCENEEIIVTLDGDDWFSHDQVLEKINAVYQDKQVWMTYGQFVHYPTYQIGICEPLPNHCKVRNYRWVTSHLRTFYAGLFKQISKEDFFYKGDFAAVSWDLAMMLPMLEMAKGHAVFIPEVLYVYNVANQLNDNKLRPLEQQEAEHYFRQKKNYYSIQRDQIFLSALEKVEA